jgi:hypothetical protein
LEVMGLIDTTSNEGRCPCSNPSIAMQIIFIIISLRSARSKRYRFAVESRHFSSGSL